MSNFLSVDSIRSIVPSVFAPSASPNVSPKYRFLSTESIVNLLADMGYYPTKAKQTKARKKDGILYAQHFLRFRHENAYMFGEYVPEIVLWGSHDRSSAVKFAAGLFRFICENGLIRFADGADESGQFSIRHSGGTSSEEWTQRVRESIIGTVEHSTEYARRMMQWQVKDVSPEIAVAYAESVAEAIAYRPDPLRLLHVRRDGDNVRTLSGLTNVVQENALKGGETIQERGKRRATTKPIKAIASEVKINMIVDRLAQAVAKAIGV